jgi:subtilisin
VLDSTAEKGPKLVEMSAEAAANINSQDSPLRAVPVVVYDHPRPQPVPAVAVGAAALAPPFTITCREAGTGLPISNARVVAFEDFANRVGDEGVTDAAGQVVLRFSAPAVIERLYVITASSHWGAFRAGLAYASHTLDIEPVNLGFVDGVRHYYPAANGATRFDSTCGVIVGVIDTGIGPHPDVNRVGGVCTVTGQPSTAIDDVDIHGTHVSGLIGAHGTLTGLAPGVALRAYRVFPDAVSGATNYAILKALILAGIDRCDVVNLSLGGGPSDPIVAEGIQDARNQGMLVVIAAGNDERRPVNFPAAHPGATAVSALGRVGTFPAGSLPEADIDFFPPSTLDPTREFIAAFSNVGPQISVTAPGVGVLSTMPHGNFGPLSGTSMAAPVVAGVAACLLSRDAVVFGMQRDRARSNAIEKLLLTSCAQHGFGLSFEGFGRPQA